MNIASCLAFHSLTALISYRHNINRNGDSKRDVYKLHTPCYLFHHTSTMNRWNQDEHRIPYRLAIFAIIIEIFYYRLIFVFVLIRAHQEKYLSGERNLAGHPIENL